MSFSVNRLTLLGNLARDPELKYTPSGKAVCTIVVTTSDSYLKDDEWVNIPSFHRVTIWEKKAERIAGKVKKGDKVYVEAKISYSSYENDKGEKKYQTNIVAKEVITMTAKKSTEQEEDEKLADQAEETLVTNQSAKDIADEIPF